MPRNKLFELIYGLTNISFDVSVERNIETYHSSELIVATKDNSNFDKLIMSINEMLDEIKANEHYLQFDDEDKLEYTSTISSNMAGVSSEIEILQRIVTLLNKHLNDFIHKPKTSIENVVVIDRVEKLKRIGSANMRFIAQNSQLLYKSNIATGIKIDDEYYMPKKTLISKVSYSNATLENTTIVNFINTVVADAETRLQIYRQIIASGYNYDTDGLNIRSGYIICCDIIEKQILHSYRMQKENLEQIVENLKYLSYLYRQSLVMSNSLLDAIPVPTATFLEVHHYRIVYQEIINWFSIKYHKMPDVNKVAFFHSISKVYENYSLINLIKSLEELGFTEKVEKRIVFYYNFGCNNKKYNKYKPNTYFFVKDNTTITLYYEPIIYGSIIEENNGISLFRTDGSYYIPDYVIKVEKHNLPVYYGIIDAKWRSSASLTKFSDNDYRSTLYKYGMMIRDKATSLPIPFIWILQGKEGRCDNEISYVNTSPASKAYGNVVTNAMGIVELTPKSGKENLKQILSIFIR